MPNGKRETFLRERDNVQEVDDEAVAAALSEFADALDPDNHYVAVPKPRQNGTIEHDSRANSTAKGYLQILRNAHERGLDLLEADAETFNHFMQDLVTDPERRRYELLEYDKSITKPSAKQWQTAARSFYRYCTEPGQSDDRPDVNVEWPADDILMFSETPSPKHDSADLPGQADLDALREACVANSLNTRRDRAFIELAAGTGQRVYALITLKIKHVHPNPDDGVPHILLNPEIAGDGDKGAIKNTGRWKPIVTDPGPVEQWIAHHPLQDPDVREEHGCPEEFEECFLFVGDVKQRTTDASSHWHESSPLDMLNRRKGDTASMPSVETVEIPVNPHNWRHYAYTRSQDLPIDESTRRKVFGWVPGSDTGQTVYGHKENQKAGREFAEAWADAFDDTGESVVDGIAEQVAGTAFGGELSPEARSRLAREVATDDEFLEAVAEEIVDTADSLIDSAD